MKDIKPEFLAQTLQAMCDMGTSVTLNWGEDNNLWEVCWITNGKRYVGFGSTPEKGVTDCLKSFLTYKKADDRLLEARLNAGIP